MKQVCRTDLTVEQHCVQFNQLSYSSLPHFPLTRSALLLWLPPVYSGVSWQHAAPSVPGHVPANSGWGGDIHGGDPECIQPPPHCTPQIWPEGRIALVSSDTNMFFVRHADNWILQTRTSVTHENDYVCNHLLNGHYCVGKYCCICEHVTNHVLYTACITVISG